MRLPRAVALVALCLGPAVGLSAQVRTIDLSGRPIAALSESFSSIVGGAELAGGGFVVVDRAERTVLLADFAKGTVTVLSRNGAGPDEYRMPSKVLANASGGAIVPDEALGRALLISSDGAITGTGLDRAEAGMPPIGIRGIDRSGRVYRFGASRTIDPDSLPIERWDPATRRVETVAWWPQSSATVGRARRLPGGGTRAELLAPTLFSSRPEWIALADGTVAIVYPSPYHVEVVTPSGRRVRGPRISYNPVQVTKAYRAWFARERGPTPDEMFPRTLPPFEDAGDLLASPSGEVWVRRLTDWNDSIPAYDIIDATGTLRGRARLNPHSKIVGFGKGVVYVAREVPEDGLWYLEKYALR